MLLQHSGSKLLPSTYSPSSLSLEMAAAQEEVAQVVVDQASADSVARRVCFEYHPYEPQMILQLCGAQLRQYDISTVSGGFRTVTAPYAGMEAPPAWVELYARCVWRGEDMTLLEWLRKTDAGEVAGWLEAGTEVRRT